MLQVFLAIETSHIFDVASLASLKLIANKLSKMKTKDKKSIIFKKVFFIII
jgi:hypothetical protein